MSNKKDNWLKEKIIITIVISFLQIIIIPLIILLGIIILFFFLWGLFLSSLWWIFWWDKIDNNMGYTNNIITLDAKVNSTFYENFLWLNNKTKILDKAYLLDNGLETYIITRKSLNLALFWYYNSPILTKQQIENNIEFNKKELYNYKKIKWNCTKLTNKWNWYWETSCSNSNTLNWVWNYPLLQLFNPYIFNPKWYNLKDRTQISTLPSFFNKYVKKKSGFSYWKTLNVALQSNKAWYIDDWLNINTNNGYWIDWYIQNWKTFRKIYWNYNNIEYLWPLAKYSIGKGRMGINWNFSRIWTNTPLSDCQSSFPNMNCVKEYNNKLNMSISAKAYKNHNWYDISSTSFALYNPFLWWWYYLWTYFNWTNSQSYLLSNIGSRLRVYKVKDDELESWSDFILLRKKVLSLISKIIPNLCNNRVVYTNITPNDKKNICQNPLIQSLKVKWERITDKAIFSYLQNLYWAVTLQGNVNNTLINITKNDLTKFVSHLYLYSKINNININNVLIEGKNLTDAQKITWINLLKLITENTKISSLREKASKVYQKIYKNNWRIINQYGTSNLTKKDINILQSFFVWQLFTEGGKNLEITVLNILTNPSNNSWMDNHKKDIYFHLILKTLHTNWNFILDKTLYNNLKQQFINKFDSYIDLRWINDYLLPFLKKTNENQFNKSNNWINNIDKLLSAYIWKKIDLTSKESIIRSKAIFNNLSLNQKWKIINKLVLLFYRNNIDLPKNTGLALSLFYREWITITKNLKLNNFINNIIIHYKNWKQTNLVNNKNTWTNPNSNNVNIISTNIINMLIDVYIQKYNKANEKIKEINKIYNNLNKINNNLQLKIQKTKNTKDSFLSIDNNLSSNSNVPERWWIKKVLVYGENNHIDNIFPFINYGDLFALKWNVWTSLWSHAHVEIIPFITTQKFIGDKDLNELHKNLLGQETDLANKLGTKAKILINKDIFGTNLNCNNGKSQWTWKQLNCDSIKDIINQINIIKNNNLFLVNSLNNLTKISNTKFWWFLKGFSNNLNKNKQKYELYINNLSVVTNVLNNKLNKLSNNIDEISKIYWIANKIFNNTFMAPDEEKIKQDIDGNTKIINWYSSIINTPSANWANQNISNYAIIIKHGIKKWISTIKRSWNSLSFSNYNIPCNIVMPFKSSSFLDKVKIQFYNTVCNSTNNTYNYNNLNNFIWYDHFQKLSDNNYIFAGTGHISSNGLLRPSWFNWILKLFAIEYYNKLSKYVNIGPLPLFNLEYPINETRSEYSPISSVMNGNKIQGIMNSAYNENKINRISKYTWITPQFLKNILDYWNLWLNDSNELIKIWQNKFCSKNSSNLCYVPVSSRTNSMYNDTNYYGWTNFLTYPQMKTNWFKTNSPRWVYYSLWIFQFLYYYMWDLRIRDWNLINDLNDYWKAVLIDPMIKYNYQDLFNLKRWINDLNIWDLNKTKVMDKLQARLSLKKGLTLSEKKKIYEQVILKRYYFNLYFLSRLNSMNTYFKSFVWHKFVSWWFILPYNSMISRSEIYIKLLSWAKNLIWWIYNYFFEKVKSVKDLLIDELNQNNLLMKKITNFWINEKNIKNSNWLSFNYLLKFIKNNINKWVFNKSHNMWAVQLYDLWFQTLPTQKQIEILNKIKNTFSNDYSINKLKIITNSRGSYIYHPILWHLIYKINNKTYLYIKLEKNINNILNITQIIKINLNNKNIQTLNSYNTKKDINSILNMYKTKPLVNLLKILINNNWNNNKMSASLLLYYYLTSIDNNIDTLKMVFKNSNYLWLSIINQNIKKIWMWQFNNLKNNIDWFNKEMDDLRYSLWKYGEVLYLNDNIIESNRYKISYNFLLPSTAIWKIISNGWMKLPDANTSDVNWLMEMFKKTKYELNTLYNWELWTNFDFTTDKLAMTLWHFLHESGWRNGWYGGSWMSCYTNSSKINIAPMNWWGIYKKEGNNKRQVYSQWYITVGATPLTPEQCNLELKKIKEWIGDKTIYIYSDYSWTTKTYWAAIDNFVIKPNKKVILYSFNSLNKYRTDKWDILLTQFNNYLNNQSYYPLIKWFDIRLYPIDWNMNWLCFIWMWQMDPYGIYNLEGNMIYKYLHNIKHIPKDKILSIIKQSSAFTQLVLLEYLWNYDNGYSKYWLSPPNTLLDKNIKNLSSYPSVVRAWLTRYNPSEVYVNSVLANYNFNKQEAINNTNSISYSRNYSIKILSYIYVKLLWLKKQKSPSKLLLTIEKETSDLIVNKQLIKQLNH